MASKTKSEPRHDISRETLETTPQRALNFLRAVGTSASIRATLMARGYGTDDHKEGWRYLHTCSGFSEGDEVEAEDPVVRDAITTLDAWDEPGIRIIRATLERRFPEQAEFVLKGIKATTGAGVVLSVDRLLERLDALETGADRKGTRKDDQAALAVLAQRGVDEVKRKELRVLVNRAKSVAPVPLIDTKAVEDEDAAKVDALSDLYAWYREWAEVARASIRRRDHLIRLGLASRKTKDGEEEEPRPAPPPNG